MSLNYRPDSIEKSLILCYNFIEKSDLRWLRVIPKD